MGEQSTAAGLDRGARESAVLEWAVRAGLVGYGVVHLLVTVLAVRVVLLGSSATTTGQGALAQLVGDLPGRLMLGALVVGFVALAVWQLIAALVGYRRLDGWQRSLMRWGAVGRIVVYAYLAFAAARLLLDADSGSGASTQDTTASVLARPAGAYLLGAAALVSACVGVGLVVFGLRVGFLGQLDEQARTAGRRVPIIVLGQLGYVVKGLAYVVLGALLGWAAVTHATQKSGGLDQSLGRLVVAGLGGPTILLVGFGFGCFGLYLFARARHLHVPSITS